MFYFSISFCFCLVTASWACTGLQTRRTCTCKAIYTFENQPNEEKTLNLPLDGYDDCGINIGCQKELDCSSYCLRQISEVLGGNRTYFTQSGQDKTCLLIMNTQSLIENGIVLWSHWTYSGCQTGKNLIISGLCCGRRCSCEIVGQNTKTNSVEKLVDFKDLLPKKSLGYSCKIEEFGECEKECREVISKELKNQEILIPGNRPLPNLNIFEVAQSPKDRSSGEYVCTKYAKSIPTPGFDLHIKLSTDPTNFAAIGKYIPLGRLCCQKACRCELRMQTALPVHPSIIEKSNLFENLTSLVAQKSKHISYDCESEATDCLKDCRNALGEFLESQAIISNSTTTNMLTSNLDVFSEAKPGSRICQSLQRNISRPGINFYLRYMTTDSNFPAAEEVHVGRLCCLPYKPTPDSDYVYVPYNRCEDFDDGQIVPPKFRGTRLF